MINRMVLNETSYFGRGSRKKIVEEIKNRSFHKILLVSDHNLNNCGVTGMVSDYLKTGGISYIEYFNIKANPTVQNVLDGVTLAKINGVDAIVAVGGGSVIDTAKAISIIVTNEQFSDVVSLDGLANTKNKGLPLFALPTTAGTAAEVTIKWLMLNILQEWAFPMLV